MADLNSIVIKADTTDLKSAQRDLKRFGDSGKRLGRDFERSAGKMERGFRGVRHQALQLQNVLAAAGLVQFSRKAIQYADAWRQVNNQLGLVTDSENALIATRGKLLGVAKDTNAELLGTVGLYTELFRSTRELEVSEDRLVGVTKTINNLFKAGGKEASETAGAVRQLNQGLAAGALRGDEFNSVAEGAPRILDALSESLGKSKGELRDFAATGGITSKILIDALEGYEVKAQQMADQVEVTFGQKLTTAKTNVLEFTGGTNSLTKAVDVLGDGIGLLSENLDTIVAVGEAAAVVYGVRLTASFTGAATSAVAYQLALARMAGVSATAAAGQFALAGAVTASSSALSLLGGPAGALALAGAGIYFWADGLTEASRLGTEGTATNKKLASSYHDIAGALERIGKVGDDVVTGFDLRNAAAIQQLQAQREILQRDLSALKSGNTGLHEREVNHRMALTVDALSKVNDELERLTNTSRQSQKASSQAFSDLESQINRQISAYRDGEVAVAAFEREQKISSETARLAKGELESEAAAIRALVTARYDAAESFRVEAQAREEAERIAQRAADELVAIQTRIQEEMERNAGEFTLSIGLKLDEGAIKGLAKEFDALDKMGSMFDGIGDQGEEAIGRIIEATKAFKAASLESSDKAFGAYAQGTASALMAVQSFTEQGSAEYKKIGVAVQALQTAQAIAAVINQGTSGDPYTAFGRMAAMAAAVASLGVSVGSISGGGGSYDLAAVQSAQGTGSVLGDATAKSESIANAIESMERNSEIEVGTSAQMLRQLQMLNQNIAGLGTILARQFGDFTMNDPSLAGIKTGTGFESITGATGDLVGSAFFGLDKQLGIDLGGLVTDVLDFALGGLFGRTSASVVDSGIAIQAQNLGDLMADGLAGASLEAVQFATIQIKKKSLFGSSTSYRRQEQELGDDITRQLGLVVGGIYESILTGAQMAFGADVSGQLNAVNLSAVDLSLRGLSGSERTEALEAAFGKIGDQMAAVVPRLSEFQVAGEGLFETLARVGSDVARAEYQLEQFGLTVGDVYAVAGESEVALELMRDALVANAGAAGVLIENFGGSEEELTTFAGRLFDLQTMFGLMGVQVDGLTESMVRGARGSEALLTGTEAYLDGFFTDTEKLAVEQGKLAKELARVGLQLPVARDGFRDLFESLDLNTEEGQRLAGVMLANADAASQFYDSLEALGVGFGSLRERIAELRGLIDVDINGAPAFDAAATRAKILGAGNIAPVEQALQNILQAQQDVDSRSAFANGRVNSASAVADQAEREFNATAAVNEQYNAALGGVSTNRAALQDAISTAVNQFQRNSFRVRQEGTWREGFGDILSRNLSFNGDNASLQQRYYGSQGISGTRNHSGSLESFVPYLERLVTKRSQGGLNSSIWFDLYNDSGFDAAIESAKEAVQGLADSRRGIAQFAGDSRIGQTDAAQAKLEAANQALFDAEQHRLSEIAAAEAHLSDVRGESIGLLANFRGDMDAAVDTLSGLRGEVLSQIQVQEQLANTYSNVRNQIERTIRTISLNSRSEQGQTAFQASEFRSVLNQTRGASGQDLATLAGELNGLANPYIQQLRDTATDRVGLQREINFVLNALDGVNSQLVAPVDMQAQSVELLTLIDQQLAMIDEGARIADELQISTGERQVELLTDIRNLLSGQDLPQFANGGIASGSKSGYMAELHGTEAVVPLPNGKSIPVTMRGSDSTAAAVAALTEVVKNMDQYQRTQLLAVVKNTNKTAKRLDAWDINGLPTEEVAA